MVNSRLVISIAMGIMLAGVFLSCLDAPPPAPERVNPWDPGNPDPPRAPDSLRAHVISETVITLSWRDRSGNESGFRIYEQLTEDTSKSIAGDVPADSTSYRLTDRTAGEDFDYYIAAYNDSGSSDLAGPILASTREAPPTPPTALEAFTASETSILLTWQDRSANELRFEIEESIGNASSFRDLTSLPPDCTEYIVTDRQPLVRYFYRVRAVNGYGRSLFTDVAWAAPGNFPPEPPGDAAVEIVSETELLLTWSDLSGNEQGFKIHESRGDTSNFALLTSSSANSESRTIRGRQPATEYYYRLRAYNEFGQSTFSNTARGSTSEIAPAAPTGLSATATETGAILTWEDRSGNESAFRIEARVGDNEEYSDVASPPVNAEEWEFGELQQFEEHRFRILALNEYGESGYSTVVSVIPGGFSPATPGSLNAVALSAAEIAISWLDRSRNEEAFTVQESVGDDRNFETIATPAADENSIILDDKSAGRTYFYRVNSSNRFGESPYSQAAEVTTPAPPAAPDNLQAAGITPGTILLTWSDRSDDENGFKVEYGFDENFFEPLADLDENATEYTARDLERFTNYYFRLYSWNGVGNSDYSNVTSAFPYTVLIYVADGPAGLTVVDGTNPEFPEALVTEDTPGYAGGLHLEGSTAYIADWYSGMRVFDLSSPLSPREIGYFDTPGRAYDVAVDNKHCCIADGDSGVVIVDVSVQAAPRYLGQWGGAGGVFGVAMTGSHAYIAGGGSGLQILDLSNPEIPRRVGGRATPGVATGVALWEQYSLVADQMGGLRIFDVGRPTLPDEVGALATRGVAYGVYVSGSIAHIADWNGLMICDVSNPSSPRELGSVGLPGEIWDVEATGGYAYVAALDQGLRVVDISDLGSPAEVGRVDTPGLARGVAVVEYK